ncbi:MAG: TlpA disulfide reductase family protein [Thermodesulfobacteriota bacterium]
MSPSPVRCRPVGRCFALSITLAILVCLLATARAGARPMPQFSLTAARGGQPVDSSAYCGRVLLVNFFATWCAPCRQEVPSLLALEQEYGRKGFSVIGICLGTDDRKSVAEFMDKLKITYPVAMADEAVLDGFGGVVAVPVTFLIGRNGEILERFFGLVDPGTLTRAIEQALQ